MGKVVDGSNISLPAVEADLAECNRRLTELRAEVDVLVARVKTLELIRNFARSESTNTTGPAAPDSAQPPASLPPRAPGEGVGGVQARDVILRVFAALPPGTELSTAELHARMRDDHGYAAPAETARKSAQRMSNRGTLVKVAPGVWRLPAPPGGPLNS